MVAKSIEDARKDSNKHHSTYMSNLAGSTYQYDLRLLKLEDQRPVSERRTVQVPAIRPSSHQERHTDKYNLRDLNITNLINLYISFYQCKYHCLPTVLSLSYSNLRLLELQGFKYSIYRNEYGSFLLVGDSQLDNDSILCS